MHQIRPDCKARQLCARSDEPHSRIRLPDYLTGRLQGLTHHLSHLFHFRSHTSILCTIHSCTFSSLSCACFCFRSFFSSVFFLLTVRLSRLRGFTGTTSTVLEWHTSGAAHRRATTESVSTKMKLDAAVLRYLTRDDFRVLTGQATMKCTLHCTAMRISWECVRRPQRENNEPKTRHARHQVCNVVDSHLLFVFVCCVCVSY